MKLIIRTDDVGYTKVHNIGTFKAIDEGLVTHLDIMLDCREGTDEALNFAKAHPWISTGWHSHLWGWPILSEAEVPSMINEAGRIKGRKTFSPDGQQINQLEIMNNKTTGNSKSNINPERASITYEDAVKECKAELEHCKEVLGTYPDFGGGYPGTLPVEKAIDDVAKQYNLIGSYMSFGGSPLDPRCEAANIQTKIFFIDYYNRDMNGGYFYNPYKLWSEGFSQQDFDSDNIYLTVFHCAYLDDMVFRESSLTLGRIVDTEFCCSEWLKNFVIEHKIELINLRDAINGTHQYQDHLKSIGSPLYIGNMK